MLLEELITQMMSLILNHTCFAKIKWITNLIIKLTPKSYTSMFIQQALFTIAEGGSKAKINSRIEKTRDLFKKIRDNQGNISCKDGLNKGQTWYGPNRSRRY